MDVFQLIGDFLHLVAILLLLLKILASKNVVGLSYKTQEMFIVVFITRYSDMILEYHWGSLYFNFMRIIFITINALTIYYMRYKRPFKLVSIDKCRVTMLKQIASHTIISIQSLECQQLFYMQNGLYTEFFKPFLGGSRPSLSFHSYT